MIGPLPALVAAVLASLVIAHAVVRLEPALRRPLLRLLDAIACHGAASTWRVNRVARKRAAERPV